MTETYFRTLLESTLDVVSMVDADGVRQYVTPSVTLALGYSPEEWLSMAPAEVIHPEDSARIAEKGALLRSRAVAQARADCRVRHKDGSYRWMELRVLDLRDDPRVLGFVGIFRDVTERKLTERALEDSRHVLEEAQAVAKVGSWVLDFDDPDRIVWSAETYRIFAVDPSEPMTVTRFYTMVHPDDVGPLQHQVAIVDTPYFFEHRIVRADGEVRWVNERARPEHDQAGKLLRMVGTVQDITDRKRTEEQLRHSQKMEAIGRLAGGVAHDFNNLLALILAQCEWIKKELGGTHPLQAELEEIIGASARGAALTRQLLAFGRRQRSSARLLLLDSVVVETERLLRRLLGEHIAIEVSLDAAGDAVFADRANIEQVLLNLAVNARDAMPKGGKLRISTRSEELLMPRLLPTGVLGRGAYAVLSVSDEGGGIEPRAQAHLFEPFFTTKALGEGTGLGLATVFGIVQEAGGGIVVESQRGRGTTFEVLLPRVTELAPSEIERSPTHLDPQGGETILLVEDDASLRAVVRRTLTSLGYVVLVAADGLEAMSICKNTGAPIDLLLTDLVMPGRDGRATADLLRAERPAMKTIFMSGYAEPEILGTAAKETSAPTLLAKPFTANDLATAIRRVLDSPST